jgi:hypothetical protein
MKFSRSDFEMQRFESRRPSQPVQSPRLSRERAAMPAGNAGEGYDPRPGRCPKPVVHVPQVEPGEVATDPL